MKKLFFVIALAAISFGSVQSHAAPTVKALQQDTTKKKKTKTDTIKKKKKDTTQMKKVLN